MEANSNQNTGGLALEVDGLVKSYGDYRALDGVSMAVRLQPRTGRPRW